MPRGRLPSRVDRNQPEIVLALRTAGFSVQAIHSVGDGCPDLLAARDGENHLIEIKDGAKAKLTDDERDWHERWRGKVEIIRSVQDVADFSERVRLPFSEPVL